MRNNRVRQGRCEGSLGLITKEMKSRKRLAFSLSFVFLLSLCCFAQEEEQKETVSTESKFTSLQKSLLIPGWGQFAEKRYIEGALFLSAEIFCVYRIFSYNHKGNGYYDQYKKADNVNDAVKFRELTEKYDTRRNKFIVVAACVWAINLIDIYFIVKNKAKKERNLKIKLKSNENKEVALTLSYSF